MTETDTQQTTPETPDEKPAERSPARPGSKQRIVTYLPDNALRRGLFAAVGDIYRDLSENRWLTYQLLRRDMFSFYRQSLLGAVWIILVPLITVFAFILLRRSGVVSVGEIGAPYPFYAAIGVSIWQIFAQGLVAGSSSLVAGSAMITRINLSKKSLVLASMGRTMVGFGVLVVMVLVILVVYLFMGYQYSPKPGLLLLPLALLPIVVLTMGLSFWLALVNSMVRDISAILSRLLMFMLLLSPILYERPKVNDSSGIGAILQATLSEYNPLYYLVVGPRDLVLLGAIREPGGFLISTAVAVVVLAVALFGFHVTETRVAEKI